MKCTYIRNKGDYSRVVGFGSPEMSEAVDAPGAVYGDDPAEQRGIPGSPEPYIPHVHGDEGGQDEGEEGHQYGVMPGGTKHKLT